MAQSAEYSVAVDIGTSTIHISFVEVKNGRAHRCGPVFNPQMKYGFDVISRISASGDSNVFAEMVRAVRRSLLNIVNSVFENSGLPPRSVDRFIISGNTVMQNLFFGLPVDELGRYPYRVESVDYPETQLPDDWKENAKFEGMPVVSAFLGGDFISGLVFSIKNGYTKNVFFIDLGTNGEMFLITGNGEIYAASCAMGPALEGMNLSSGMTASPGAIGHIHDTGDSLTCSVIGGGKPYGLAGTAVVDIMAVLVKRGLVKSDGSLNTDKSLNFPSQVRPDDTPGQNKFELWDSIGLTQKDVRNIQLAKGACLAAARIMLKESGVNEQDIAHVLVAGAFGENLNVDNFKELKFIPEFQSAEYEFLGNTSLAGAESAAVDSSYISEARRLRDKVNEVELATRDDFNKEFIASLNFQEQ